MARCTRCDDCIKACPSQIINRGSGGFPEISFAADGCDFCDECATACIPQALQPEVSHWSHAIRIEKQCLAFRRVECRVCAEQCDSEALKMQLRRGGPALPQLTSEKCNGCGACIAGCPVGAIEIDRNDIFTLSKSEVTNQ